MGIQWNDSYCIGDSHIDRQHQELFVLANRAIGAVDQPAFKLAAMDLYRYMRKHFSDEEKLMREVNYPAYKSHIELHNAMILQFNSISQDVGRGLWNKDAIRSFMTEWVLQHVGEHDAKIAAYIRLRST
jgi:hemerythrin